MKAICTLSIGLAGSGGHVEAQAQNVTGYHGDPGRSGMYVVPGITWTTAPTAHPLAGWRGAVQGNVLVQPLYWIAPGAANGMIIVGTDQDVVQALDSVTGAAVWTTNLGPNVTTVPPQCPTGGLSGIKGTPVIDATAGAIYLDAFQTDATGMPQHLIYGLSLIDGSVLPGWPLNVQQMLAAAGYAFTPNFQAQHAALALVGGIVYVSFGGPAGGDCGDYHGWVVGVNVAPPSLAGVWQTRAEWGGIWSPGGIAYDGTSLFVTTGNTVRTKTWTDGEAVIRLPPALQHSIAPQDFFTPLNWQALAKQDLDLSSTGPVPIDVPIAGGGTAAWLLALGKPGNAYLLDRSNLGGLNGALLTQQVAIGYIDTAPAVYQAGGGLYVAISAPGSACPQPAASVALTVLSITAQPGPAISTAWCASFAGTGMPIVTTSDGVSDPVVWMAAPQGDMLLHAFRGDTGQVLFTSSPIRHLRRFATPMAAEGRLYVPTDGRVVAFAFESSLNVANAAPRIKSGGQP